MPITKPLTPPTDIDDEGIDQRLRKALLIQAPNVILNDDMVMKIKLCGGYQFTEEETAYFIGVHINTLRRWFKNIPELKALFIEARSKLMGKAKMIIHDSISEKKDEKTAKWLLENKASDEYAKRQINDNKTPPLPEKEL